MRPAPDTASEDAYATKRESQEKLGGVCRRSPDHASFSTVRVVPPSAGCRKSVPVLSEYAIHFESGDHAWRRLNLPPDFESCFGSADPSAGADHTSYSPVASESHAIVLPSGLHAGSRSATPLVCVRLRGLPSFAGKDHTSPRAPTIARLPEGESSHDATNFAASTARGR